MTRALAACLCLAVLSGCGLSLPKTTEHLQLPKALPAVASGRKVVLLPVTDSRDPLLTQSREAALSRSLGVAALGAIFMGWTRRDGAEVAGDRNIDLGAGPGKVVPAVDGYVVTALRQTFGAALQEDVRPADLADVRSVARARGPDAVVVVPVLDELDLVRLVSQDEMGGGSSYESGNYQVTTTQTTFGSARTHPFANVRLRFVLLDVRQGEVVRQRVVYSAETNPWGSFDLPLEQAMTELTRGAAEFVRSGEEAKVAEAAPR